MSWGSSMSVSMSMFFKREFWFNIIMNKNIFNADIMLLQESIFSKSPEVSILHNIWITIVRLITIYLLEVFSF
jgi:hypothetical protein